MECSLHYMYLLSPRQILTPEQAAHTSHRPWLVCAGVMAAESHLVLVACLKLPPKAILQNKDELTIPLELSMIPTPKATCFALDSLGRCLTVHREK